MENRSTLFLLLAMLSPAGFLRAADGIHRPVIDGPWWQVAGDPNLGPLTREKQQPVDFGLWQASDGTWQLWSCIRHTGCGGNTRLFYHWEGKRLTDTNWTPMGVAQQARTDLGETLGGQQAPHVVKVDGLYYMAYGDWVNICFSTSTDGKQFTRVVQAGGKTGVFSEGPGLNTRDPMLIEIDDVWYCYYTAHTAEHGYDFCRTTVDLASYQWSHSSVVAYGGAAGDYRWSAECPHVVELSPGHYYLFRTQRYGRDAQTSVYHSTNPLNFGIDDDTGFVGTLPVAAPEIIRHEGQYYLASLMPSLKGIHIARLKWVKHTSALGEPLFDLDDPEVRAQWKVKQGDLPAAFTTSTRSDFNSPTRHFIGTAELADNRFNDDLTGIIESAPFTIGDGLYSLLVSGGADVKRTYVALIDSRADKELVRCTGRNSNRLSRRYLDTSKWKGKTVRLRLVDQATGPWGHINCAGIFRTH